MPDPIIKHLNRIPMERHSWLIRAGEIARRLNEESKRDGSEPNKPLPSNQ